MSFQPDKEIIEKTLPNGEVISLYADKGSMVVECFDADGNSRWYKTFGDQDLALAEYNRWS